MLKKIAWVYSVPSKRVMEGQPVGQYRVDLDRFNITLSTCGLNGGSDCVHDCPGSGAGFQDAEPRFDVGKIHHAAREIRRRWEELRDRDNLNRRGGNLRHCLTFAVVGDARILRRGLAWLCGLRILLQW